MKIVITNNETDILTAKDFTNLNPGLAAQACMEMEIIKKELMDYYMGDDDDKE